MRTLLITDLHLNARVPGLLDAQCESILKIFNNEKPDEVIIMGDVFMYRKPSPSELLSFKKILDNIKLSTDATLDTSRASVLDSFGLGVQTVCVYVLRGNHDSETKADDGVTSLSLFEDLTNDVKIINHTWVDKIRRRVFIPHYENEETIISALEMVPKEFTVFGHFGYDGCLNSAGDADFGIPLSNFTSTTFLGHIHGFREGQGGLPEAHTRVVCLGTPYTTNFGECFKDSFYAVLSDNVVGHWVVPEPPKIEFKKANHGPRHLVYPVSKIEDNLETINDPNYFTFLRVMVGADHAPIPYEKLDVAYIDVKYAPIFNEEEVSSYNPDRDLFSINEMIISDYVESANSTLSTGRLMEGYRLLKNED